MRKRADILVIKLSALGDFVLAMPAFERIRAAHPNAPITLLTTPPYEELAKASPYFDRVWSDGRPGSLVGWLKLVGRMRRARFARVYDLQTNDRTQLLFLALRPFPPRWSGTAVGAALRDRTEGRMAMHTLERQASQLQSAGIWPNAPVAPGSAPPPDLTWLIGARHPRERLAILVPGSAPHRLAKRWPAERYGALAAALIGSGYQVAIVGGADERPLATAIRAVAPEAVDLSGKTALADIARLGARAALVVGNDTGPTHLAAAAGAPTIALFSSDSDPALCAPRGRVEVLRSADLALLEVARVLDAVARFSDSS